MYNCIARNVVATLGKFVFLYESEKLRTNKDKKTKLLLPNIVETFNSVINPHVSIREKVVKTNIQTSPKLYMIRRVSSASNLNTFLYHLRNAFAHGQIEIKNDYYLLIDYEWEETEKGESSKTLSAYGFLRRENLDSFIDKIINDYEGGNSKK